MCSRFLKQLFFYLLACSLGAHARDLRVCADPDNLPFSNRAQQGFENRIARLLAHDLRARLEYRWQRMGRGFVREYLGKGRCDLLIGIPANYKPVLTTAPYYRSTYVFVTRRQNKLQSISLDNPALRNMKIGVQAVEEEYTPPGDALARRGMQSSIVGFDSTGSRADSIIRAVAGGKVDVAIAWGPLAGYFAHKYHGLVLTAIRPEVDPPGIPFTYAIAMGVRKGNTALRDEVQHVINRRYRRIARILQDYGVPQLEMAPAYRAGE